MQMIQKHFIFPEDERKLFSEYGVVIFVCVELLLHGMLIVLSICYRNNYGIYLSLFLAFLFGLLHMNNLQYRKYCLAQWSFDGDTFHVYIKDEIRTVDIGNQFCISSANLSFARRYGAVKYLFILIWEPGNSVPYEEMGAYAALKKRNVLIVPYCEDVLHIFNNQLQIKEIPLWPKSSLYYGKR